MSNALIYALLSLLFAGALDVAYKRYARKDRSRGMHVFGIGTVWLALQGSMAAMGGSGPEWSGAVLTYGLAAGIFLVLSNLLFMESLSHIPVGLGSTIYRLNTIGVVALSFTFLGEPLGAMKLGGIFLGILGVLLLYQRAPGAADSRFALFCGIAVAASALRAGYGVISKAGLAHGADLQAMLLIAAACWVVGGAAYALLREGRFRLTWKKTAYSLLTGILVFLIVNFLILAVRDGEASVVIPVANLSFVMALGLSAAFGMERITPKKLAAVGCAVGAILLLTRA